ncbi:MAG: hypothetical protein LC772_08190 [Chloroflexi bacterium]|nr:hypothetical protein [Chloroflexota bacterium]
MAGGDQLYLTDTSLCDEGSVVDRAAAAGAVAAAWQRGILFRVEVCADSAGHFELAALQEMNAATVIRCGASPDQIRTTTERGPAGVTILIDSVAALARRPVSGARPPAVLKLIRAIRAARERQLEVVVAFPFEPDRLRSVLHLGYLVQSQGVERIRLMELTGRLHPMDLFRALRSLRERLGVNLELDVSDECGLSAGAALCAVRAGVRHLVVSSAPLPDRRHLSLNALLACMGSEELLVPQSRNRIKS